jgi:sec-independent protein translocase protein TatB
MFDIGFWEIALIFVIGLVVLGPERLPVAIRSVIKWINAAKSVANTVKSEISQELKIQEMNENMIKASKKNLCDLDPDLQKSVDEMKQAAQELVHPYKKDITETKDAMHDTDTIATPETPSQGQK